MVMAAFAVCSASARGQGTSTIVGQISDRSTKLPVAGAEVVSGTDSHATMSDSAGRFALKGLTPGHGRLVVRAVGFPAVSFDVELPAGDTLIQSIQLDSTAQGKSEAQQLPSVPITAKASLGPRYADFERRVKTGRGQYLTADQLEQGHYSTLQEAMRTLRGVEVSCGGGGGCYIKMARAPMQCVPEYIVDDRVDDMFGPLTPVRDIQGLEVYTGPSDVPGEYAGRNAGCGVIVIWTKSGPPAQRRRP
jgi:hypothetical protein